MLLASINFWAVLVAAIVAQVFGFIWYSQKVAGKKWIALMNFSKEDMERGKNKGMKKQLLISSLAALVMAYVLAYLITYLVVISVGGALTMAFIVWLGFVATTTINDFLWNPNPKPIQLYFLNNLYYLLTLALMSLVLFYML